MSFLPGLVANVENIGVIQTVSRLLNEETIHMARPTGYVWDRAKDFDSILNECIEAIVNEGATVQSCLRFHPQYAEELKPLLEHKAAHVCCRCLNSSISAALRRGFGLLTALQMCLKRRLS